MGGYRTSTSHALQGGNAQKRGRGYSTQLANTPASIVHAGAATVLCTIEGRGPTGFTLEITTKTPAFDFGALNLEAQQQYFSHRAILVAIVSQNSFVLVFVGYRTIIVRYVAKWGIAQMCLCETKYQEGVSHHFGEVLTSLKKYRVIWGIAAIVSQYRAIWGQ